MFSKTPVASITSSGEGVTSVAGGVKRLRSEAAKGLVIIIAGLGIGAISSVLFAKLLSAEEYGIYVVSIAILNYTVIVARGGMESSSVRYLNEYSASDEQWLRKAFVRWAGNSLLKICALVTGIGLLASVFVNKFFGLQASAVIVAMLGLLPLSLIYFNAAILRAEKRIVESQLPLQVGRPVLALVFGLMLWIIGFANGTRVAIAEVLGLWLIVWPLMRRTKHFRQDVQRSAPRKLHRQWSFTTREITLSALSQQLIGQADILMVGLCFGMAEAGVYALASRLAKLVLIGNRATDSIVAPMAAEAYYDGNRKGLQAIVSQACLIALGSTVLMSAVLLFIPDSVFAWLGPGFTDAKQILILFLLGQVVNALTGPVGVLLLMTGHQKDQIVINTICGLALAGSIYVVGIGGGSLPTVAILFVIFVSTSNVSKAIAVYLRTGIVSAPAFLLASAYSSSS